MGVAGARAGAVHAGGARRGGRPVVALVGPTASGKSDIASMIAAAAGAEIVAVDAFTVYRGMDVGTAKPPPQVRAAVPHHMVDVLEPSRECTVQWFQTRARAAIDDVRRRGATPLLVGGSGLYFRAVVDDLVFPPTDPHVRAALVARYQDDPAAAHSALAAADPDAARRIEPGNLRRTVRALEVRALTGRRFSTFAAAWQRYESIYSALVVVGLDVPRETLRDRIDGRVDAMFAGGLVDECRRLRSLHLSTTARQAIGYAEVFDALDGNGDLADAAARTKTRTRRYAARQRRWFAADPRVGWHAPAGAAAALVRALRGGYEGGMSDRHATEDGRHDEGSYGPRDETDPTTESDAGLAGGSGATTGEGTVRPGTIPADREVERREGGAAGAEEGDGG